MMPSNGRRCFANPVAEFDDNEIMTTEIDILPPEEYPTVFGYKYLVDISVNIVPLLAQMDKQ